MKSKFKRTTLNRVPSALANVFSRHATAFARKPCRFLRVSKFAPVRPGFPCVPNTSGWCGESRSAGPLPPATIPFPGAENATTPHRSCDELLVFDPFANQHKHGEGVTVIFDNTPSKQPPFLACLRAGNAGN